MNPESSKLPLPPQVESALGNASESDRRAVEDVWRLAEHGRPSLSSADKSRKREVWAAVSNATRRTDREEMPRPRRRLVTSRTWRRAATAAVVALLVGVGYMLRPITVEAPYGSFAEVTLPDGSQVQLNSGSNITYRAHFVRTRAVDLEGEAFFDVVRGDKPFVVETANAKTTVLGTEFNVWSRSDRGAAVTSVVVASGRVRVAASADGGDGEHAVILNPSEGTEVSAAGEPSAPSIVMLERELAWRHGGFAFNAQPFSVIFAEIERRYDVEVDVPSDIAANPFTIYLQDPASAEDAIANLTQAEGLRYRETANGFQVYRP